MNAELMLCVFAGPDSLIMRVVTSDSGSVSVGNQYTDDLENPDTSDDAEFWRKGVKPNQNTGINMF